MKKILPLVLLLISFWSSWAQGQKPQLSASEGTIIVVKFNSGAGSAAARSRSTAAQNLLSALPADRQILQLEQPFANHNSAKNAKTVQGQEATNLANIYKLTLSSGGDNEALLRELRQNPAIAYAEVYPEPQLLEEDTRRGEQTYLNIIKAAEAWNLRVGDQSMIIGVLDTGTELSHPELAANLYTNPGEIPNNAIDDDQDGYIDNYHGWDFANNDANPSADRNPHGLYVAGVIAAAHGNGGIAGVSNNCRYMPIKIFSSHNDKFINGYEAIVYAADRGCKVINLSWGGTGAYSQFVQDIIDYAVLQKDAVVVAAAGNTPGELDFYPASNQHVLSVGATKGQGGALADEKANWSTHSRYIDISGPAEGILTTTRHGNIGSAGNGTSYTTPMVSSAAALVRLAYPELKATQVMELLRQSADDLYHIGSNSNFLHKLGKGRLNMERALAGMQGPSVRATKVEARNKFGNFIFRDDTVTVNLNFTNYLAPTENLKITIESESPYVALLNNEISISSLRTLGTAEGEGVSFQIRTTTDLPANEPLTFKLLYLAANYTDYQYLELRSSGEYVDLTVDDLTLTVSANGNLGYNYDFNLQGLGLLHQNVPLAHNMGLIIAANSEAVANNMLKTTSPARRDQDFTTARGMRLNTANTNMVDALSAFKVSNPAETKLNLVVEQQVLGWKDNSAASSIITEYRIFNQADTAYQNLHYALFTDFNLGDQTQNRTAWNSDLRVGYTYQADGGRYAGVALLTEGEPLFYGTEIGKNNGHIPEINKTITKSQKYQFVSQGTTKTQAGQLGSGNDVAQFTGLTLANLAPQREARVALALVSANSLAELEQAVINAQEAYARHRQHISSIATVTLCNPTERYTLPLPANTVYRLFTKRDLLEPAGEGSSFTLDIDRDTVLYVQTFNGLYYEEARALPIFLTPAEAEIAISTTDIRLENNQATLQVATEQKDGYQYRWYLDRQEVNNQPAFTYTFTQAGTYQLVLEATNAQGCQATESATVTILPEILPLTARAYPNPTAENITVLLPEVAVGQAYIELANLKGQVLLRQRATGGQTRVPVAMQHLPAGVYLLRISAGPTHQWHQRIVKQ